MSRIRNTATNNPGLGSGSGVMTFEGCNAEIQGGGLWSGHGVPGMTWKPAQANPAKSGVYMKYIIVSVAARWLVARWWQLEFHGLFCKGDSRWCTLDLISLSVDHWGVVEEWLEQSGIDWSGYSGIIVNLRHILELEPTWPMQNSRKCYADGTGLMPCQTAFPVKLSWNTELRFRNATRSCFVSSWGRPPQVCESSWAIRCYQTLVPNASKYQVFATSCYCFRSLWGLFMQCISSGGDKFANWLPLVFALIWGDCVTCRLQPFWP